MARRVDRAIRGPLNQETPMFHLLAMLAFAPRVAQASDSLCDKTTTEWIQTLESGGCPPLGRLATKMKTACQDVEMASWDRDQKTARKRFLADCEPTAKGFPGVIAPTLEEGLTISHCGRLVQRVRGDSPEASLPEDLAPDNGFDRVMGIVAAAGFACSAPPAIDTCIQRTSVHTATDQLLVQEQTCQELQGYPLDTTMWAVALLSGAMPTDPFTRKEEIRAIIDDKVAQQEKRQAEAVAFQKARTDELTRATSLAADCLVPPPNMHEPDQAGRARTACESLLSLWRGDDPERRSLEAAGAIPIKHATTLAGKVLNSKSLQVTDRARVEERVSMLKTHQEHLIKKNFAGVLDEEGAAAAQAFLTKYAGLVDSAWSQDAQDRVTDRAKKEADKK
jgi:hypothetical protein